ncbi:MAG: ClbS/DfsB family four-helix bundle protein [Roseibium sp.]|uniref:ClbS/DfsB family four-helix bundle protein n=1 Tax=Roseibium sp. TaxID=1936156 RepID=UPI00262A1A3D|nr:ClbS/DfsB family four-helix bundle protein [Roseibium sp.]MCV0423961.1 ClbS/DfsB family four-helix bundle protein [Roseibium sp.]
MAATSKSELLEITRNEFDKLSKLIGPIDVSVAMKKDGEDTSIKDIVAHRAHWIDLFLGWYADGQDGKTVFFPAEGYRWNDLKRYNADLRKSQISMDWPEAKAFLQDRFHALHTFNENHTDEELYGGPMKGANNTWTPGRWAEAAGPSHFRSASKFIRSELKNGL